jgi:hypothetical protein
MGHQVDGELIRTNTTGLKVEESFNRLVEPLDLILRCVCRLNKILW